MTYKIHLYPGYGVNTVEFRVEDVSCEQWLHQFSIVQIGASLYLHQNMI